MGIRLDHVERDDDMLSSSSSLGCAAPPCVDTKSTTDNATSLCHQKQLETLACRLSQEGREGDNRLTAFCIVLYVHSDLSLVALELSLLPNAVLDPSLLDLAG